MSVKVDALTYAARPFGVDAPASSRLGGFELPLSGEFSPATVSDVTAKLWLWFSFQFISYFTFILERNPKARMVLKPAFIEVASKPLRVVRLNRAIRRKLRRLERREPRGTSVLSVYEPQDDDLSPTQFLERMIRLRYWSRVRAHNLGLSREQLVLTAIQSLRLQGSQLCMSVAALCSALLSPD